MPRYSGQIDGKTFELRAVKRKTIRGQRWGHTTAPSEPHGTWQLVARDDLSDLRVACTVAHEILHVADWGKEEWWVDQTAEHIARALHAFGFRRIKSGSEHDA